VHNWVLTVHGAPFGLQQWGHCDCSIYLGRWLATVRLPAACVAAPILFLFACIVVGIPALLIRTQHAGKGGRTDFRIEGRGKMS
jgi:hypothetical protein